MRLGNWMWLSLTTGPRLTWWIALAYSGGPILLIIAALIAVLLVLPKPIVLVFLQVLRTVLWLGPQ